MLSLPPKTFQSVRRLTLHLLLPSKLIFVLQTVVQPQCYGSLCAIVAIQALYYDKNWSPWQGVALFGAYCALGGGWEFGIYRAMVRADQVGVKGIPMLFGILSDIFLTAAFL